METLCLLPKPTMVIECLCFDQKVCDIHIDDGGNLVCRCGSNEGIVDGIAKVICPLEIESERKKWEEFLAKETNDNTPVKKTRRKK
jgi:hypothetical protein